MADSDETRSFASASLEDESPLQSQSKEPEIPPVEYGFSLIVLIKELSLVCLRDDEPRPVEIQMGLTGVGETEVSGTIAEFNQQRQGNAITVPCETPDEFKDYIDRSSMEIKFVLDGKTLGQSLVKLSEMNLGAFDPPGFEAIIATKTFNIYDGPSPVGCIKLILKTDRYRSSVELNASKIEDDSIMFIVNDREPRRSSELQEDTMRQLLTCKKCNVFKSPSEISCQYELIDGILVNREHAKKDIDLETMKRKIDQIEREAKLYPVGQNPEPLKEQADPKFCESCGGYSITGATCKGLSAQLAEMGFPEGSAKRFENQRGNVLPVPGFNPFSEPTFGQKRDSALRLSGMHSQSDPFQGQQRHGNNYLCPRSIGYRFCERCALNMDWLPPHSSCPKCGFRIESDSRPPVHEISPSHIDSWMGSLDLGTTMPKRPSSGTANRSSSLETKPCPLCRLRGGRCPDCQNRTAQASKKDFLPNSSTLSSTSDSEVLARKDFARPRTRQSLRDRIGFPRKLDKKERISQLNRIYGEDLAATKAGRKSSVLSLNVEEILKKSEAHKKKIMSDGIQSVELRKKVGEDETKKSLEPRCSNPTAAEIRKNQKKLLLRVKKQNRMYSYSYGHKYPGIVLGHKNCVHEGSSVPPHMGWMWNIDTLGIGKKRKGWRPGAVKKPIKELMRHFLVSYPLDNIPVSKTGGRSVKLPSKESGTLKQKPTLQIVKRNGEYTIVMNPLKDSNTLKTAQDPYLPCEPIKFKLAKDPHTSKLYQLRKALQVKGFNMCGCDTLEACDHRSGKEKKLLEKAIRKLSRCLGLPKATGLKDIPTDSESEMDLEFTPPSAMLNCGVRKPDVVCTETQYCEDDYKVKIPTDKLKCKPGVQDPKDITRAGNKLGKGPCGKDGKAGGKDCKEGKGGKDAKGAKDGKGGKDAKGGKTKTAGGKGTLGSLNKSKIHRPEGSGPVVILKEPCQPSGYQWNSCMPAQNACAYGGQASVCYPTACAPTYGMCYGPY